MDTEGANQWMKLVGEYGVPVLFLGCTVGILLYVAVVAVGLFQKWLPKWFESSIDSHNRIAKAIEKISPVLEDIHGHTCATKEAAAHSVRAAKSYKEVPSSVMIHLNNAEHALGNGKNNPE